MNGLRYFACVCMFFILIAGCSSQKEDVVFNIRFTRFLTDGRPVIEVTANGRPIPKGTGPFGDYILVLRPDSSTPYTRQFQFKEGQAEAVERDFAIPKVELKKFSSVSVSVVNPEEQSVDKGTILSNVIEIPLD